ncbi:uncharacterized protein LOC115216171 isoform X1 [Octopus sinensis]|uniref:Uncharacterized protein LOC115216171 isoform X1 n=2 Tax=Octopus sinensis TaxID=2607531 RepID=A0A6P7SSS6_9MOLL|nr:uncharacterized protein LOC115216171 isoform X1 [Octopus sinensis]
MSIRYKFFGSASPLTLYSLLLIVGMIRLSQSSLWDWQKKDKFDHLDSYMKSITEKNCHSKLKSDLLLSPDTVSQIPRYNQLLSKVFYRNRTGLVHLHNLALNRAYFHSFMLQRFNQSKDFLNLPGWLYLYMSVTANVNSHPNLVNGSSIFFDNNCHYPNWLRFLAFNKTLPLFAPSAWRYDDTRDSENFLREPTMRSTKVVDMGTGLFNYTSRRSKTNIWYSLWNMPDVRNEKDSLIKYKYTVGIKYSSRPGQFDSEDFNISGFFGPSVPGQHFMDEILPVRFTQPYFDCGKSNEWIVSAVSPVIDFMPRYLRYTHMRRPRIVALVTMDTYFRKIDFNACPISIGNPLPNYLAGIDRCKPTTKCKHVSGYGFKRGGYKCVCKQGYKYPSQIKPPFQGSLIEQATQEEYEYGFTCTPIQHRKVHLGKHYNTTMYRQQQSTLNTKRNIRRSTSRHRRNAYDKSNAAKIKTLMKKMGVINNINCHKQPPSSLSLSGSVIYGAEKQFESQARTALRLAHFLSSFLQNNEYNVHFGILDGGQQLQEDHIFAEVLANVMSDHKILSSAVLFDSYQFIGADGTEKALFGPWAYRNDQGFWAIDAAGLKESYLNTPGFKTAKERFRSNISELKEFHIKAFVRSNINGTYQSHFKYSDLVYKAPTFKSGRWSGPTYRCDGRIDKWVITYSVPFFSRNIYLSSVKFTGIVLIDIDLKFLDINQCHQPFYIANAFKNTALCPPSTKCSPLTGFGFGLGNYACKCKQGYEYPFEDAQTWFEGVSLELEWSKKMQGEPNRLHLLHCRVATGPNVKMSLLLLILMITTNWIAFVF